MKNRVKFFTDLILRIAQQSDCRSRNVGSILVKDNRVLCEGWNGTSKKCDPSDCIRCNAKMDGKQSEGMEFILCSHSEANLIANAAYMGIQTKDCELWVTTQPCSECAKLIVGAGIKKVFYMQAYKSHYSDYIFKNGEVECIQIQNDQTNQQ